MLVSASRGRNPQPTGLFSQKNLLVVAGSFVEILLLKKESKLISKVNREKLDSWILGINSRLDVVGMRLIEARVILGKEKTLQIFVDHLNPDNLVATNDCKKVNDWFDENPDTLEWVSGSYNLEISSPGLERPLRLAEDWQQALTKNVSFALEAPVGGRRKGQGVVQQVRNDAASTVIEVKLENESSEQNFAFNLNNPVSYTHLTLPTKA